MATESSSVEDRTLRLLATCEQLEERTVKAVDASTKYKKMVNRITDTDSSEDSCEFNSDGEAIEPQQNISENGSLSGEC